MLKRFIMSLLKKRGENTVKKHRVDYLKGCVEEKVGHAISDEQYKRALERSYKQDDGCKSMQGRIDAVARYI